MAKQAQLGSMHARSFAEDPKHLGFVLARYKFVAKMLAGKEHVLEVGCGDGTGGRIVRAVVGNLVGIDADPLSEGIKHDMLRSAVRRPEKMMERYDAAFALDVLEHIRPEDENRFLRHVIESIAPSGVFIVGSPSLESQAYASPLSRQHHVNCKTEDGLRETLRRHFGNVFLLGLNDEALHTGFGPMTHYRLAICTNPITTRF